MFDLKSARPSRGLDDHVEMLTSSFVYRRKTTTQIMLAC